MYINNTHNNTSFSGQMIVIGKKNKNTLKKFAKQVNNMRIVKNSKYNLYVSYGSIFGEAPVYVSAQKGTLDKIRHFSESIRTVLHPDALSSAAKRAIIKADKEQSLNNKIFTEKTPKKLTPKQKLLKFCDNIMNRFLKFFQDEEEI